LEHLCPGVAESSQVLLAKKAQVHIKNAFRHSGGLTNNTETYISRTQQCNNGYKSFEVKYQLISQVGAFWNGPRDSKCKKKRWIVPVRGRD